MSNPQLYTEDRPIAGKILGPKGEVIKVVKHGPEKLSFGFAGQPVIDTPPETG